MHILKLKKYLSVLIYFFGLSISNAQDPQYIAIDKSNGLPSNTIYDIFQDSKGFMWFTCDKGLIKYDGFRFITFNNKSQSSSSGTNIKEDAFGRIWYQNFDGYMFYVENDSLLALKQNTPIGYSSCGIIKNKLFLMKQNGVDVFDLKSLKRINEIKVNTNSLSYTNADDNYYYINDSAYIYKISADLKIQKIQNKTLLTSNGVTRILSAGDNIVLYGQKHLVVDKCYTIKNDQIVDRFTVKLEYIQNTAYTDNSFWFCTPNGVYNFSYDGKIKNSGRPYFSRQNISYVLKDREGNFWFSTLNNGLLLVTNIEAKQYFKDLFPIKSCVVKNDLYLSTSMGKLFKVDLTTMDATIQYQSDEKPELSVLFVDTVNHNILLNNNPLEVLNKYPKKIFSYSSAVKDIKLVKDNYYSIAMSGMAGLYRINENKKDEWTEFINLNKKEHKNLAKFLNGSRARCTEYNSITNTIYFGTSYGFYSVTPNEIKEIRNDTNRIFVNRLCNYRNIIYGLTNAGEIITIVDNKIQKPDFHFKEPNESVSLIKVCKNFLIISTNYNLYCCDLSRPLLETVLQHGINYDITDVALWKEKLLVVSKEGIIIEDLKTSSQQNMKPLFYFDRIKVNGKTNDDVNNKHLSHEENNIEINYTILSFRNGFNFPLYFKINDNVWEKANSRSRAIKLSALAPGNYTILFKLGELNDKNYQAEKITFSIAKPFWQTVWFITLCILCFLGLVFILFKWRVNELNSRNKLLEEKVRNEQLYYKTSLKAIRAQMNPHFFYNALNTIQSFIYSEDKKNASTYLSKFSKLTRLILEMSDKENITLAEEMNAIQLYLDIEKVRFNDEFKFEIHPPKNVNADTVFFPPMLIQPYIENAIKHGLLHKKGAKYLKIDFVLVNDGLEVTIDDNGIGRKVSSEINSKKETKHNSFSSKANEERLEILAKNSSSGGVKITDKFDENNNPAGTIVVLNIQTTALLTENGIS